MIIRVFCKYIKLFVRGTSGQVSTFTALVAVPLSIYIGVQLDAPAAAEFELPAVFTSAPARPSMTQNITIPAYTYSAVLTRVYDADTWRADVDLGFNTWRHDEALRLYAVNAPEIKLSKKKGVTAADVKRGYECRDAMLSWLGQNPRRYARKARYIELDPPVPVVIQTVKDKKGKYGRMLAILHKDGVNLNERLVASGCSAVELYDGKTRPTATPITPHMK